MLKIKLARFGKKNQPHYRFIVNEGKSKRDGEYIALLGNYAPTQTPKLLEIDVKAFDEWVAKGAQPTDTVASLVRRFKAGNPFPKKAKELSRKAKAKAAQPKEEVAAVVEKPAEEVVAEPKEVVAEEVKSE